MNRHELFQQFVVFTTAVHEIKHGMTQDLRASDITSVQYNILEYIAVSQPVTLSEISDCMHLSMPNASREMRKLLDKGLCTKDTAAEDRRVQYIRLSPQGQAMMDEVFQRVEARFRQHIGHLTEAELEEVQEALQLLQIKVFRT